MENDLHGMFKSGSLEEPNILPSPERLFGGCSISRLNYAIFLFHVFRSHYAGSKGNEGTCLFRSIQRTILNTEIQVHRNPRLREFSWSVVGNMSISNCHSVNVL